MKATVKYQIGTYSGECAINCNSDDEDENIIARAKGKLRKMTSMPMFHESYKIISRIEC